MIHPPLRVEAVLTLVALAVACGAPPPTREEIQLAENKLGATVAVADQARAALEVLGILPVYTCGEPRRTFVGRAANDVQAQIGCIAASTQTLADSDILRLDFDSDGCQAKGRQVTGAAAFTYSGGEDRLSVDGDLDELKVDGELLLTRAGYGTCGDEKRYWGKGAGPVPRRQGIEFAIDATVAQRDGVWLIGSDTLVLDGTGELKAEGGVDRVTCTALAYEVGNYLPKEGSILIETSGGHSIQVTFRQRLWRLGQAEVVVNGSAPTVVPVVR